MPFEVADREGVLTLTLDTPGSPVNIFNHATARQLTGILSAVTPSRTRAIVFETAKPNSFINGVGLLLAHASQTYDDVVRASMPPWTAYRAVREAPVPTIAVVQGNCFGCGVEFVLSCDYRIAGDSCETQFYMTELNDYLFNPLFGGTWNLPQAVGLSAAIDLLLWGERWSATTAWEHGLVDEVVPWEELAAGTRKFVTRVMAGKQASRRRGPLAWETCEDEILARARQRIEQLPPLYHEVYGDALRLLEAGARQRRTYAEHQRQELRCSAASALSPLGKAAYGFFYLRQMASERAAGRTRGTPTPLTLSVEGRDEAGRALAMDLRSRKLPGVAFVEPERADFRLIAASDRGEAAAGSMAKPAAERVSSPPRGNDVAVEVAFARGPTHDVVVYAPFYRTGSRLFELATRARGAATATTGEVALLARVLQRFGLEVARTTPQDTFVSTRLLTAFFAPLARWVEADGGAAAAINTTMRVAGFVRQPGDLLSGLDHRCLAVELAPLLELRAEQIVPLLTALQDSSYTGDRSDPAVLDVLCVSLLDAVLAVRSRHEVSHPSVVDLIARELLDFPRHLTSLCTWLRRSRVARAIDRGRQLRSLVTEAAYRSACAFVAEGRELYR